MSYLRPRFYYYVFSSLSLSYLTGTHVGEEKVKTQLKVCINVTFSAVPLSGWEGMNELKRPKYGTNLDADGSGAWSSGASHRQTRVDHNNREQAIQRAPVTTEDASELGALAPELVCRMRLVSE
jgi:hypothetical protein